MTIRFLWLAATAAVALSAAMPYAAEIAEWRRAREARLKADDGWLSLVGLFWLHEGANAFGRNAANEITLPDGPDHSGIFELRGGTVTVAMNGSTRGVTNDSADFVAVGRLKLLVIQRGDKIGIRVKDPQSSYRREFHGIQSFPADERYRVTAKFVAEPRQIPILNVLGQTDMSECPGYAQFRLNGKELRLYPVLEQAGAKELFYIFRDETTGKTTYPAGRFLYSDLAKDGHVVLDFNKAYNPPCAFTPYATCPLPPKENRLAVRIEAGEKTYGH